MIVEQGTWAEATIEPPFCPATLATYLKDIRKRRGLTVRALARDANIAQSYLSRLEAAKAPETPSYRLHKRLADFYGIAVDTLFTVGGYLDAYGAQMTRQVEKADTASQPPSMTLRPSLTDLFIEYLAPTMSPEEALFIPDHVKVLWIRSILRFSREHGNRKTLHALDHLSRAVPYESRGLRISPPPPRAPPRGPGRRRGISGKVRLRRATFYGVLYTKSMSQTELAREIGISGGYFSQLLGGKRCAGPKVRPLILAAPSLSGFSFGELFEKPSPRALPYREEKP